MFYYLCVYLLIIGEVCMAGTGSVSYTKDNPNVRQVVTTSKGEQLEIPVMMGSTTDVKPLKDGTYEVKYKPTVPNAQWETKILTEDELVARYGKNTGNKLQTIA